MVVTGLILDPETRMTEFRSALHFFHRTSSSAPSRFQINPSSITLESTSSMRRDAAPSSKDQAYPPTMHSREATSINIGSTWIGSRLGVHRHPFQLAIEKQQTLSERNLPYLRHSWNRIDFIAVVAFWIMFILAMLGVENTPTRHIYIFRALSVLRIARLLAVTNGTTVRRLLRSSSVRNERTAHLQSTLKTIMRSLKIAGPLLVNVALFVLFAVLLFSIVGVQAFKGSMRRNCQLGKLVHFTP